MLNKNTIYSLLLALGMAVSLTSCQDDPLTLTPGGEEEETYPGYVLSFTMTLDDMGGGRSRGIMDNLSKMENYIDPQKVRVLFFDNSERFLFESKSRWVKKLDNNGVNTWLVSVPFYPSGNDRDDYDWPWDSIRSVLTSEDFRIAVLVNRPQIECYPDLQNAEEDRKEENNVNFDNSGPFWTKHDYRKKTMIDLHHTQWDPIYTDKGMRALGALPGFYQFVMAEDSTRSSYRDRRMLMSSTSCWVDMGPLSDDKGSKYTAGGTSIRKWRHPTQDYPIPMYGIQRFPKITNWAPGTPFHLSEITPGMEGDYKHKSISLLRSVVKLELLIDKSIVGNSLSNIQYVGHKYINIYARCEPIDLWTPTDELWQGDETTHTTGSSTNATQCEWDLIMDYGAISRSGDTAGTQSLPNLKTASDKVVENDHDSFIQFRERISFFYGAWKDLGPDGKPRWDFAKHGFTGNFADSITNADGSVKGRGYPHIFNPITQRNGNVYYDKSMIEDRGTYYYCVVYCGEQNINDPSDLFDMDGDGSGGSGKSPTPSWILCCNNKIYSIPIIDHNNGHTYVYKDDAAYSSSSIPSNNVTYNFQKHVYANYNNRSVLPWPLVRNHVYRIVVGSAGRSGEITAQSEHYYSPIIRF